MLKGKYPIFAAVFLLVCNLMYRLTFKDDFMFKGILQIVLYAFFDLSIILLFVFIAEKIWINHWLKNKILTTILKLVVIALVFYLLNRVLKQVHFVIYDHTVGFSTKFLKIFNLESYQVFDTYLVMAFGATAVIAFDLYRKWKIEEARKEQSEKERIAAELNILKAQINPHFIFNTLNNIHFLIDSTNTAARQTLNEFSELLRYQIYETGVEKVSLFKEIQYLENYIALQEIRKEKGFKVSMEKHHLIDVQIAPLLLIVPLENAFKHSGSSAVDFVNLQLSILPGNIFRYSVVNSRSQYPANQGNAQSGIGLPNLRKRLELIYGNRAHLVFNETAATYEFVLTLILNENETN